MKPFSLWLTEARKNPEQNPKISAYEALKKYKDDPDIYISMTEDLGDEEDKNRHNSKIGINPKSIYNTPLGIYSYDLKTVWKKYNIDKTQTLDSLPFAGKRPYVWVLRSKNKNFVKDMYTDYTSANYDRDIIKLKEIWLKEAPKNKNIFISYDHAEEVEHTEKQIEKYESFIQDIKTATAEEQEAEKFDLSKFEKKLKFWKEKKEDLEISRINLIKNKIWDKLVENALGGAKDKNPVMSFWNLTRLMAGKLSKNGQGISASTKWNWLLRQCGYSGFADKSGKGYIHPSEPVQAVFLSKDAFTVVEKVLNKDYSGSASVITSLLKINNHIEHNPVSVESFLTYLSYDEDKELTNNGFVVKISNHDIIVDANYKEMKRFVNIVKNYYNSTSSIDSKWYIYKTLRNIVAAFISNHTEDSDKNNELLDLVIAIKPKKENHNDSVSSQQGSNF